MPSIQSSPHPLVFRLAHAVHAAAGDALRTSARALEGMQKEAIVSDASGDWRMVCDEGPYLNGTDLAPFPLAFFTAGLAAGCFSAIRGVLARRGIACRALELTQDNRYSMTGSALNGTMTGGALPVELAVRVDADAETAALAAAVAEAVEAAPATGLLRRPLASEFALTLNGERVPTGRVPQFEGIEDAPDEFEAAAPAAPPDFAPDIIEKLESAQTVFGVEGGAGTSLAAEQKRTLHVRGVCRRRPDGLVEIRSQLLKPIGSVFRFLASDGDGPARAPSGLAYLSAGIAFCYLTQLGRYAHIVERPLTDYWIVQDARFEPPAPVRTHVHLSTPEGLDHARTLVDMGEQTCFLHAACRSRVEHELEVVRAPA